MPVACGSQYQLSDRLTQLMHVWLLMTHTHTHAHTHRDVQYTQLHPHMGKLFANCWMLKETNTHTHTQIEGIPMCGWLSVCARQTQTEECKQQRLLVLIPAKCWRTWRGSAAFPLRAQDWYQLLFTVCTLFVRGCLFYASSCAFEHHPNTTLLYILLSATSQLRD